MLKIILFFILAFTYSFGSSQIISIDSVNKNADTTVYTKVDTTASFPGGKIGWHKFLQKNLNAAIGAMNGAGKGKYDILIRFIVDSDGALRDFKAETNYGYMFEEEVIRILKLSPKWIPAKLNGVYVSSYTSQNQIFVIEEN